MNHCGFYFVQLFNFILQLTKNSVPVDMIFAFATTDEGAHIRMMMDLWNIFTDKAALKKLRSCKTKQDVLRFVQQYSQQG